MRSRARRRTGTLLVTVAVTAGVAGCSLPGARIEQASSSTPVELEAKGAPSRVTVGVVVSLTSEPGQGADWSRAAEGAQVAAYRYRLGGVRVRITPMNDKGSAAGARDAVRRLVAAHVSGIVMATDGDHVQAALAEAQHSGTPVLLPYGGSGPELSNTAWSTGPDRSQVGAALADVLHVRGLDSPVLINAGGGELPHVTPARRVRYRPGDDPAALARIVVRSARSGGVDALVVSGPAELQGQLVAALQGLDAGLPLLVTPHALSPSFATALEGAGGSIDIDLTTVGTGGGDTTTLQPGGGASRLRVLRRAPVRRRRLPARGLLRRPALRAGRSRRRQPQPRRGGRPSHGRRTGRERRARGRAGGPRRSHRDLGRRARRPRAGLSPPVRGQVA